jgi:predicted aspartyl protease
MRKTAFCALLVSLGFFLAFSTDAQTMTARVPMREVAGKEIVKATINGNGPYDFILDTGANTTLVKRQLLLKLNIRIGLSSAVTTSLGESQYQCAIVKTIAIAGLSVEGLEINTLEGSEAGLPDARVQGVLGENFLRHFDLLIDNEQHTLELDRESSLEDRISGEHLLFLAFGRYLLAPTPNRIVVELKVPSVLLKPFLFVIDSGASSAVLYPMPGGLALRAMQNSLPATMRGLDESRTCGVQKVSLEMGTSSFRGIDLVACEGVTRNKMDSDGLLPTRIFHQFFISHKRGYVIANPKLADGSKRTEPRNTEQGTMK